MEFDELKKAWGQFNDKVNGQTLIERQQVEEMLTKKRMTHYSRLLWYERISLGVIFILFVFLLTFLLVNSLYRTSLGIAFLSVILIALGINLFQYRKLKQAGCMKYGLERQILYILQYKASLYWGVMCVYVAIIPGIILFIIYTDILRGCIVVGAVLLGVILDIFTFRHIFRKVGQFLEANKELKRLGEIMQNE